MSAIYFNLKPFILAFLLLLLCNQCGRAEYTTGHAVFENKCMKCHKLNGDGGTKGPDLTNILQKKDENYVRTYTEDPRSIKADGTMPPSKLSDRELDLLIHYMKEKGRNLGK